MMLRRLFGYDDYEFEESNDAPTPREESIPVLLEPFLRRVVREEVERIQTRFFSTLKSGARASSNQIDGPLSSRWQLQFKSKLPHTLFTGSRIETEQGNSPVQLAIVDTATNGVVTCGPLASLRVDVVAVDGDFCRDDWTPEEFAGCLLRQREGKPQLLTGDLVVTLEEGIGYLGDVYFTDNSSWIRSRKFRLGLRAPRCGPAVGRVREGLSDAFLVKDHRGESYKKHHPPSTGDEVWRLDKIGKDGAFHRRLADNGINTVQDLLKLLVINQDGLRNILGNGMSNKIWEATVQHAWECEIGSKPWYCYPMEEHQATLYFDSIYRVVGVDLNGFHYKSVAELASHQKALVNQLKELAYRDHTRMIEIGDLMSTTCGFTLQVPGKSGIEIINSDCSRERMGILEDPYHQKYSPLLQHLYSAKNLDLVDPCQYNSILPYSAGYCPSNRPTEDNHITSMAGCSSFASDFDLSHDLLHASGCESCAGPPSPPPSSDSGTPPRKSKWIKLLTTLRCGMSIRKRVAAKRREKLAQVSLQMYSRLPNMYEGF